MNWELAVAAVVSLIALVRDLAVPGRRQKLVKQEIEILEKLPDGPAKDGLIAHINSQVDALVRDATEKRRDPFGVGLALTFIGLGAWMFWRGAQGSDLWFLPATLLIVIGIPGFIQDVVPRRRDER